MKKSNQTKGITLIALIITIIVLLILAGVTISMLSGEDGILNNAKRAARDYQIAQGKEQIELVLSEWQMNKIASGEETIDLVGVINGKEGMTAEKTDDNTIKVTTQEGYEYEVIVDEEGKTEVKHTGGEPTGESEGSGSSGGTTVLDETPPVVSVEVIDITTNSVTLKVTASDEGSGIAEKEGYIYYLGDTLMQENIYTYTGLEMNKEYTLKVTVTDKAGNAETKSVTATTATTVSAYPIEEKLKAGDYVNYVDKNGNTQKCIVLYDAAYNTAKGTNYGIQIITADTVENIKLGSAGISYSQTSYNSAISTLNTRAGEYLNTTYASTARCVGSVPNNPASESSYSSYQGLSFKGMDNNYQSDWEQMNTLNIHNLSDNYWLASRYLFYDDTYVTGGFRFVSAGSLQNGYWLFHLDSDSDIGMGYTRALKPVFTLRPEVIVTGGAGTYNNSWELGI